MQFAARYGPGGPAHQRIVKHVCSLLALQSEHDLPENWHFAHPDSQAPPVAAADACPGIALWADRPPARTGRHLDLRVHERLATPLAGHDRWVFSRSRD